MPRNAFEASSFTRRTFRSSIYRFPSSFAAAE
jgi:hypothetical protein